MLNGVVKGDLKLSKNINKYLDMCLKCNKCTEFCPGEINALDILLCAKHEYFKNSFQGKIYSFLESKLVFNTFLNIVKNFCGLFHKKIKSKQYERKAIYFGGCISKLHPEVNNFVTTLLNELEIESVDVNFNCCGMPFLTTGNIERFIEQAKENISKLPIGINTIITDCASCRWALNEYKKYIEDEKLKDIEIKSIYELIAKSNITFESTKNISVTYHKPCHENNNVCEKIISSIKNIEYKEMDNYDKCCGFAGFEHPEQLKQIKPIMNNKKNNIEKTKADVLITSCVGCLISLSFITGFRKKTRRLITFLKDYCKIIK